MSSQTENKLSVEAIKANRLRMRNQLKNSIHLENNTPNAVTSTQGETLESSENSQRASGSVPESILDIPIEPKSVSKASDEFQNLYDLK